MDHISSALCVFHGKIGSEGHSERGTTRLIHLHNRAIVRQWSEELPVVRQWSKPTGDGERDDSAESAGGQVSDEAASVLAERFGTTERTVCT